MKKIKVLSYFNGMNCIGLALKKLGIEFELYACEIDKYATQVSDALFPNTVNLGDVRDINFDELPVFDLIAGGSPCQGFSFAGKQLNFEDERSKLFFDFVKGFEVCKKKNPNLKFLLENVKMKKEYEAVISRFMGIDPIQINSALLSAQNRQRLYWTNIGTENANLFGIEEPGIKQPKDKGILLKDVLELEVDEKYFLKSGTLNYLSNPTTAGAFKGRFKPRSEEEKAVCLTARYFKMGRTDNYVKCAAMRGRYKENCLPSVQKDNLIIQLNPSKESGGKQPYQQNRVYSTEGKSPCLDTDSGRKNILQVKEATKKGFAEIEDGQCFDATFPDSKTSRGRKMEDKSNCLTDSKFDFCQWKDAKIRRLTPKECARLQTVPEWAIDIMLNCGVSDTQLYKMLGNGWTVDIIAYILNHEYKN